MMTKKMVMKMVIVIMCFSMIAISIVTLSTLVSLKSELSMPELLRYSDFLRVTKRSADDVLKENFFKAYKSGKGFYGIVQERNFVDGGPPCYMYCATQHGNLIMYIKYHRFGGSHLYRAKYPYEVLLGYYDDFGDYVILLDGQKTDKKLVLQLKCHGHSDVEEIEM